MVRFKVLFQSFKFRIRFVFGGGLAHSHFVFIIIYFLKYFNCLKENINYTLLDTVQQQHKYMYQDSTNDMQIVCILLKLHGALCSLARAVQLNYQQLLFTFANFLISLCWLQRLSGPVSATDARGVSTRYYLTYRLSTVFFQSLQHDYRKCPRTSCNHSLHLHVGLTLTSMKTETVLPLLTVHYCMKAICEKCLYYTISGKAN